MVMHGFAAALFWLVPLPHWWAILFMPVLIGSAWHALRNQAFRTMQHSLIVLRIDTDCRCEFQIRAGDKYEATLLGTSFVAPYFTILNLKVEGVWLVKHLVIFPDAINEEDFRRLRVWLKWRCLKMDNS